MGVDFVRKAARSFEKHLDFARADLAQADLFSRVPTENRPSYVADVACGSVISEGQELCAHREGSNVTLRSGLTVVATIAAAAPDVLQAITDSYGVATATVQEVHQISGTVEVTLC